VTFGDTNVTLDIVTFCNSTNAASLPTESYLENKQDYLDYPAFLTAGWPIATGLIEGTAKWLVKDRMEITGARWSLDGAEAVLRLRALVGNGDFDDYFTYHLDQQRHRDHHSRYQPTHDP
jgi:hypothetical protein